eukprot:GILK01008665.1.p1 GENE.GILK01008665.1~~GILK01008665.1.p1  ORF type:complete len:498 (+),score=112.34 GILK01008665.1:76-1569(+)
MPIEMQQRAPVTPAADDQDIDDIRKQNFNLKLKCHYLDEALARLQKNGNVAIDVEKTIRENIEMKVQMNEMQLLVDEKNHLLIRARDSIENLQADLELAHATESGGDKRRTLTRQRLEQQNKQIMNLEEEVLVLQSQLREYESRDIIRQRELRRQQQVITQLQGELLISLEQNEQAIVSEATAEQLHRLQSTILEKDAHISQLEEAIQLKQSQVEEEILLAKESMETLETLEQQHEMLQTQFAEMERRFAHLTEELQKSANEVSTLRVSVKKHQIFKTALAQVVAALPLRPANVAESYSDPDRDLIQRLVLGIANLTTQIQPQISSHLESMWNRFTYLEGRVVQTLQFVLQQNVDIGDKAWHAEESVNVLLLELQQKVEEQEAMTVDNDRLMRLLEASESKTPKLSQSAVSMTDPMPALSTHSTQTSPAHLRSLSGHLSDGEHNNDVNQVQNRLESLVLDQLQQTQEMMRKAAASLEQQRRRYSDGDMLDESLSADT